MPYLYEREGTNCENLPETHEALRRLRSHIDSKYQGRMLLAEANQWPEDAAAYFGEGDECQMAFHFPVMPRLFMALRMEDRFPVTDILAQTPPIPENSQWALFLRNHDELTLEMVTDEERDYMYRTYARLPEARINLGIRRRLAPLLGNNRRQFELLNALLFSLPGTPVIYYGDEIAMGDNVYLGDRNGVRTPMQWSPDLNAGFSRANPQRLYLPVIIDPEYNYETVNVQAEEGNPDSTLSWTKRLIALRRRHKAFGRGTLEFLNPRNRKVLTFLRRYEDETILVVANLSRTAQFVELDLSAYKGLVPVEMLGRTEFPMIGELPYLLTLGPNGFFWFSLGPKAPPPISIVRSGARSIAELSLPKGSRWEAALRDGTREQLEAVLPGFLMTSRWFGGKARDVTGVSIVESIPINYAGETSYLTFVRVTYAEGDPDVYVLPLAYATGDSGAQIESTVPPAAIARLRIGDTGGLIYDATRGRAFPVALLDGIIRSRRLEGSAGAVIAEPGTALHGLRSARSTRLEPTVSRAEQSNTSIVFGDRLILKLIRRVVEGVNPDLEVGRFLAERAHFPNVPPLAGSLEYKSDRGAMSTLVVMQGLVTNQGDAWSYTLGALREYWPRVAGMAPSTLDHAMLSRRPIELSPAEQPDVAEEVVGPYLASARLLGRRTGELHRALGSDAGDPAFSPEPFTILQQRSLYQSARTQTNNAFVLLQSHLGELPEDMQRHGLSLLERRESAYAKIRPVLDHRLGGRRIRTHGDFHLGQALYTGGDFVFIDFEGEPARSLEERRSKRSPLRDVAGMVRSFDYAVHSSLGQWAVESGEEASAAEVLEPWATAWRVWVSAAYLGAYLDVVRPSGLLPASLEDIALLLDVYLWEKAAYELEYELNNRPTWAGIPIRGLLRILGA